MLTDIQKNIIIQAVKHVGIVPRNDQLVDYDKRSDEPELYYFEVERHNHDTFGRQYFEKLLEPMFIGIQVWGYNCRLDVERIYLKVYGDGYVNLSIFKEDK